MTRAEIEQLLSKPTITVPEAGQIIGLSRNHAYAAAGRGEIPTIRFGGLLKVPTASLKRKLCMEGDGL
jgi:hypothetical protein